MQRNYNEWQRIIREEYKVHLENCRRDAEKAIHEAKRNSEEAETRVAEMSRQIEAMLRDAREGNARIERAERAILEATERAKLAEEEAKKANARVGTSERAVVGATSGEGETKRELMAKEKQFVGLEESGKSAMASSRAGREANAQIKVDGLERGRRSVKAKVDHSRQISPPIQEVGDDDDGSDIEGGNESKQNGRSTMAKADHFSPPILEIGLDDGPIGRDGHRCNSMDIESGNESEASVNLHALIQEQEYTRHGFEWQGEQVRYAGRLKAKLN